MSRVMFVISVICTLVLLFMIVVAIRSFAGDFINPMMDPAM